MRAATAEAAAGAVLEMGRQCVGCLYLHGERVTFSYQCNEASVVIENPPLRLAARSSGEQSIAMM